MRLRSLHEDRSQDILRRLRASLQRLVGRPEDIDGLPFDQWAESLRQASKVCGMQTINVFINTLESLSPSRQSKMEKTISAEISDFSKAILLNKSFIQRFPTFFINAIRDYGTIDDVMADQIKENIEKYGIPDDGYNEWHQILAFPDGSAWFDLRTNECEDESTAMKHCGEANGRETLLSYRTSNGSVKFLNGDEWTLWRPHVTAVMNRKTRYLTQIKGRANRIPDPKYFPYIVKLLESNYVRGIDTVNTPVNGDFTLDLLDPKDRERLLKKKEALGNIITPDEARHYFNNVTYGWKASKDPQFYIGEVDPYDLVHDVMGNWNEKHFNTVAGHVNIPDVKDIRMKRSGVVEFKVTAEILSDLIKNKKQAGEYSDVFYRKYIDRALREKAKELIRSGALPEPERW